MADRPAGSARTFETRLPCPVCLVMMEKAHVRTSRGLTLDHCARCGGVWFEKGEVQQLAATKPADLWARIAPRDTIPKPPCHGCGAPLDRDAEKCAVCGRSNQISCPACDQTMERREFNGLILDVCKHCHGVWFDHKELAAIWTLNLAAMNARRSGKGSEALAVGGDVLLNAMFWTPGLVVDGAVGLAHVGGAAFEMAGGAAESIFDVIVSLISSIFDG